MKTFTFIACILLAMLSLASGVYLGVYEMFIGGIVDIIDAIKITPTDAPGIAYGIAKVIFFEIPIFIGAVTGFGFVKAAFGE